MVLNQTNDLQYSDLWYSSKEWSKSQVTPANKPSQSKHLSSDSSGEFQAQ